VHAREILADDSQCEELCAREDRDDGSEEREPRRDSAETMPSNVNVKPTRLASRSGRVLNPVNIVSASDASRPVE
jgi:hypothetical protein